MENLNDCCAKIKPCGEAIFISSRIRLARNLSGEIFQTAISDKGRTEIFYRCQSAILKMRKFANGAYCNLEETPPQTSRILLEKNLISSELEQGKGSRGVFISSDAAASVMVNEEDHLRIQVIEGGLCLKALWKKINSIDDSIEKYLPYAFSSQYGYLTACPTNTGTGMRASVMMHLLGLAMSDDMEKITRGLNQLGIVARGSNGEGSDPVGAFYQISNQQTLGFSEQDIIERITNICVKIAEFEQNARQKILEENPEALFDKIARAWAILESAIMISTSEATECLSALRLASDMGFMPAKSKILIDETLLKIRPAHLSEGEELTPKMRDIKRAAVLKSAIKNLKKPVFGSRKKRA